MVIFFRGDGDEERREALYAFQDRWEAAFPEIETYEGSAGEEVADAFSFLCANWPYFLQEKDYVRMDSLLAVPGFIPDKLEEDRERITGDNPFALRYLRTDPLGLYSFPPAEGTAGSPGRDGSSLFRFSLRQYGKWPECRFAGFTAADQGRYRPGLSHGSDHFYRRPGSGCGECPPHQDRFHPGARNSASSHLHSATNACRTCFGSFFPYRPGPYLPWAS